MLFEGESPYQFVQVRERPGGERVLYLNEGWAVHSRWRADAVLTGGYWDAFLALPLLTGRPDGRLAVLGNAGGTTTRAYGRAWPDTHVDGVEIDPLVSEVGERYLGLDENPNAEVHTDDARVYLHGTDAATTRSWWTPTASRTSRSTSRRRSSSSSPATG